MRTSTGTSVAPHQGFSSRGMIIVKQEPNEQMGLQGRPMHPGNGMQHVPPLPTRTAHNYRVTGRGNTTGLHRLAPAPTRPVDLPLRPTQSRRCAGLNCSLNIPMDYPHLRCRECRSRNVPRRPELSMIMTPAQLLARDRKLSAVPPLPLRVTSGSSGPGGLAPPPLPFRHPPPPLPSRFQRPQLQVQVPGVQRDLPPAEPSLCHPIRQAVPAPVKVDPDIDADMALQALLKPSSDSDGDSDIVELEYPEEDLTYPDSGNATPVDIKPPPLLSGTTLNPALPSSVALSPNKRRKVSHIQEPEVLPKVNGGAAGDSTQTPSVSSVAPPLPYRPPAPGASRRTAAPPLPSRRPPPQPNAAASSSTLNLCSEPNCQNALPTMSTATRCMPCISKAWKSKRSPIPVSASRSQDGKKKAVTWADKSGERDEFDFRDTTREQAASRVEAGSGNVVGWDSDLTELSQSEGEGGSGDSDENGGGSGSETEEPEQPMEAPSTPIRTGLKIRIPPRPSLRTDCPSGVSTAPKVSSATPTTLSPTSPAEVDTANPPPPTSSPTPGEGDDDMSSPALSTPITTPETERAPPAEVDKESGLRVCSVPRCTRTLPRNYHWKSCVVCRASARGYQRRRQNLQGRHAQLDVELRNHLKENGIELGNDDDGDQTPPPLEARASLLASGSKQGEEPPKPKRPAPIKVDIEPFDDDDRSHNLVPGARVCTARDCSFVVPPLDEYQWKLCNKCRTRSKEGRSSSRRRKKAPPKEYRHEIVGLEALAMKRENGRCLSSDCGMLIGPDSKYPYCRQCRLQDWRLKRRNLRAQAILDAERTVTPSPTVSTPLSIKIKIPSLRNRLKVLKPPPRPPTPYPEYKNLAGLLANFRVLSKNFFDAQTMHFAHQPPGSSSPLSIFIFDGEFSLVAPDLNVVQKRKAHVEKVVGVIQREVGAAAALQFSEKKYLTMFNHGIVTRFVCWRHPVKVRVPVPVPAPPPAQSPSGICVKAEEGERPDTLKDTKGKGKAPASTQEEGGEPRKFILKEVRSYHRVMEGELEVSVFADKSHPFIPGERTVVRVRLVG